MRRKGLALVRRIAVAESLSRGQDGMSGEVLTGEPRRLNRVRHEARGDGNPHPHKAIQMDKWVALCAHNGLTRVGRVC